MKRSKIFLGLAALMLAGFGAVSATTKTTTTPAYFVPNGGGCELYGDVFCDPTDVPTCQDTNLPGPDKQLYAEGCDIALELEAGF